MALPAGWYPVSGDPSGTQRYWDGEEFSGAPKRTATARGTARFNKPSAVHKWQLANPVARLIAAVIDYGAPLVIVAGIANGMGVEVPRDLDAAQTADARLMGALLALYLLNQVVLVGLFGMSLGRTLLGLRVVDARTRDRPPGMVRALVRTLLIAPGLVITVFFFILGRRQGFHDLAAGTAVVYV